MITQLNRFRDLVDHYDAFLIDASRRSEQVAAEMQRLGLTPDLYAHLATSGEGARR